MGTDPHQYEQLLMLLRAFNVKVFECSPDGHTHVELFPAGPDPVVVGQVPLDQKGKVTGEGTATPYHKLFGGNVPRFKSEA